MGMGVVRGMWRAHADVEERHKKKDKSLEHIYPPKPTNSQLTCKLQKGEKYAPLVQQGKRKGHWNSPG